MLKSGTPGEAKAEADEAGSHMGGQIVHSVIAGQPIVPGIVVQPAPQCTQGRIPETGALCTHGQWFVLFYICTDSFFYHQVTLIWYIYVHTMIKYNILSCLWLSFMPTHRD